MCIILCVAMAAGESELVGTTMYMAPELFQNLKNLKYTQVGHSWLSLSLCVCGVCVCLWCVCVFVVCVCVFVVCVCVFVVCVCVCGVCMCMYVMCISVLLPLSCPSHHLFLNISFLSLSSSSSSSISVSCSSLAEGGHIQPRNHLL